MIEEGLDDSPDDSDSTFLEGLAALDERLAMGGPSDEEAPSQLNAAARERWRRAAAVVELLHRVNPQKTSNIRKPAVEFTSSAAPDAATGDDRPALPSSIGRFRVERILGRGAVGVVYLAWDPRLERKVAIKVLQRLEDVSLLRFQAEAMVLAGVRHAHIVQIFEQGTHEGRPFLVMEYVPGRSLAEAVARTPQPDLVAARWMLPIVQAVAAAHAAGIVHRDLKPGNILLDENRIPKVSDFGLAKRLLPDGGAELTEEGMAMGTPGYMAPEQASGRSHAAGPAADIYGLGAVLYELLTGRPPFTGLFSFDVLQQIVREDPILPHRLNRSISRDLETICMKCLEKEPQRRYSSATELAQDLERYLAGEPVLARPVGWLERGWRWCLRNRLSALALIAFAVAVVVGSTASAVLAVRATQQANRADREADEARSARTRAEENAAKARRQEQLAYDRAYLADMLLVQNAWEQHQIGPVRLLLDQQLPERTDGIDRRGFEWFYWHRLAYQEHRVLRYHDISVSGVACSPDGREMVSADITGKLRFWDTVEERETGLLEGGVDPCYSSDGRFLATVSPPTGTLIVWNVRERKVHRTFSYPKLPRAKFSFSPDSRRLAYPTENHTVRTWNVDGEPDVAEYHGHSHPILSVRFSPDGSRLAAAANDGSVRLWDVATRKEIRTLTGTNGPARDLAFHPTRTLLAVAFADGSLHQWNWQTGAQGRPLIGHTAAASTVCFSPEGTYLISGGYDRTLRLWDFLSGQEWACLQGHIDAVRDVCCLANGRLASASDDRTVYLWRGKQSASIGLLPSTAGSIELTCYQGEKLRYAAVLLTGDVRVWDVAAEREVRSWPRLMGPEPATQLPTLVQGKLAYLNATRDAVNFLDLERGEKLAPLRQPGNVHHMRLHPDGRHLLLALSDGTLRLRETTTGREAGMWRAPDQFAVCVAISPDGKRLAACGDQGGLLVQHLEKPDESVRWQGPAGNVSDLRFSPDGRLLVGSCGPTVHRGYRLWDAADGRELHFIAGSPHQRYSMAFTPDGTRLATVGGEETIQLWDVATGRELLTLRNARLVNAVCFTPEGEKLLASTSMGVKIWPAPRK